MLENIKSIFNKNTPEDTTEVKANKYTEAITKLGEVETGLTTNSGMNFLSNVGNYIFETFFYLLCLVCIAFVFFYEKVTPFDVLGDIERNKDLAVSVGQSKLSDLVIGMRIPLILTAVISFLMARILASNRHYKNKIASAYKSTKEAKQILDKIGV